MSATTTKNRGGRPKGSKSQRDRAVIARMLREFDEGLRLGVLVHDANGAVVIGPDGKPLRRRPSAAWLQAARQFLKDCGALDQVKRDPAFVTPARSSRVNIGPIIAELRAKSGLGQSGPVEGDDA